MSVGGFEPFWLGPSSRRLYAALHRAAGEASTGVVLVPPLLHELPRSRRFITEVASELAALGLPTLRFDFFGTGDSSGSGDALDFASMHIDLGLAVAALREQTRIARLVLLSWRGSALHVRNAPAAKPDQPAHQAMPALSVATSTLPSVRGSSNQPSSQPRIRRPPHSPSTKAASRSPVTRSGRPSELPSK